MAINQSILVCDDATNNTKIGNHVQLVLEFTTEDGADLVSEHNTTYSPCVAYLTNIHELKELIEDDDMVYNIDKLKEFIITHGAYGFIYRVEGKPVGLAYGCCLLKPNGLKEFYLHSIGILTEYQNKGYGGKFFESILAFAKENGFYDLFLSSSQSLQSARHIYEKYGVLRACDDEIIFYYPFTDSHFLLDSQE